MSYISVCKNVLGTNNKNKWVDPLPAIRVSNTPSGKVTQRAHTLAIKDQQGNIVAEVVPSTDGKPVISCGAKVAIITEYPTEILK